MKVNWGKFVALFSVVFFLGCIILFFSKAFVALGILGAFAVALLFGVIFSIEKDPNGEQPAKEQPKQQEAPKPKNGLVAFEEIIQKMIALNIKVRVESLQKETTELAEAIIDQIRYLVPVMYDRFSGEELTWELSRLSSIHFPDLIGKYMTLPPSERRAQIMQITHSLTGVKLQLDEISELVKKDQVGEFSRKAKEINMKYGQGPSTQGGA